MRVLCFDPASKKFGVAGIEFNKESQKLSLYMNYLIEAPDNFSTTQRTMYMAHMVAAVASIDKPDCLVSEEPWGAGFSKSSLSQLIGAMKAEMWSDVKWQGVSAARRLVLGDSWGGAKKRVTAEWLLQYPWDLSSKRKIESELKHANPDNDDGYDILDAILHGLCYLVSSEGLIPVHKEKKEKKRASKSKKTTS